MQEIDNKQYMTDAMGRLCPVETVSEMDKMRDEVVREIVSKAKTTRAALAQAKTEMMDTIESFCEISAERYNTKWGGSRAM